MRGARRGNGLGSKPRVARCLQTHDGHHQRQLGVPAAFRHFDVHYHQAFYRGRCGVLLYKWYVSRLPPLATHNPSPQITRSTLAVLLLTKRSDVASFDTASEAMRSSVGYTPSTAAVPPILHSAYDADTAPATDFAGRTSSLPLL